LTTHLPFIQQPCGDVLAETAHLSTEEFGAYQLLCFAFWQHGALPNEDARLARIVRATPERWAEIRPALAELFGIDWEPERLSKRRNEVEEAHLRKSEGGRKGAQNRWRPRRTPDSIPNGIPSRSDIGSASGSASGNYNYNHNHNQNQNYNDKHKARALEDREYTREVDAFIPKPISEAEGELFLKKKGVFPPDLPSLLPKLMRGELRRSELEEAC